MRCVPVGAKLKDVDAQDDVPVADRGKCSICGDFKRTFLGNADPRLPDINYDADNPDEDSLRNFSWNVHVLQCGHSFHGRCLGDYFKASSPYGEFNRTGLEVAGSQDTQPKIPPPLDWRCPLCQQSLSTDDKKSLRPYSRPQTNEEIEALEMVEREPRSDFYASMGAAAKREYQARIEIQNKINADRQRVKDRFRAEFDEVELLRKSELAEEERNFQASIQARANAIIERDLKRTSNEESQALRELKYERDQFRSESERIQAELMLAQTQLDTEREDRLSDARMAQLVRDQDAKQAQGMLEAKEAELMQANQERLQAMAEQERVRREAFDQGIETQRVREEEAKRKEVVYKLMLEDNARDIMGTIRRSNINNPITDDGKTLLVLAIMNEKGAVAEALLAEGAEWPDGIDGDSVEDHVITRDLDGILRVLIRLTKIKIDGEPGIFPPPLWKAVESNSINVVKALVDLGADILIVDSRSAKSKPPGLVQLANKLADGTISEFLSPLIGAKKAALSGAPAAATGEAKKEREKAKKRAAAKRRKEKKRGERAESDSPEGTVEFHDSEEDIIDEEDEDSEKIVDFMSAFSEINTIAELDPDRAYEASRRAEFKERTLPAMMQAVGGPNAQIDVVYGEGTLTTVPLVTYAILQMSTFLESVHSTESRLRQATASGYYAIGLRMLQYYILDIIEAGADLNIRNNSNDITRPSALVSLIATEHVNPQFVLDAFDKWVELGFSEPDYLALSGDGSSPGHISFVQLMFQEWTSPSAAVYRRMQDLRAETMRRWEVAMDARIPNFKLVFKTKLGVFPDLEDSESMNVIPMINSQRRMREMGEQFFGMVCQTCRSARHIGKNAERATAIVEAMKILSEYMNFLPLEGSVTIHSSAGEVLGVLTPLETACFYLDIDTVEWMAQSIISSPLKRIALWESGNGPFRSTLVAACDGYDHLVAMYQQKPNPGEMLHQITKGRSSLFLVLKRLIEHGAIRNRPGKAITRKIQLPQQIVATQSYLIESQEYMQKLVIDLLSLD